jgi:hypothetical protein
MFAFEPNKSGATAQWREGRPLKGYSGDNLPAEVRTAM